MDSHTPPFSDKPFSHATAAFHPVPPSSQPSRPTRFRISPAESPFQPQSQRIRSRMEGSVTTPNHPKAQPLSSAPIKKRLPEQWPKPTSETLINLPQLGGQRLLAYPVLLRNLDGVIRLHRHRHKLRIRKIVALHLPIPEELHPL